MVTIGFIVEGSSEKILFDSQNFKDYLSGINVNYIPEVINAEGNGNLLPHNIEEFTNTLINKGASKIFIVTDLDLDLCVTKTKERINGTDIHQCIISKKAIEAWFLADTTTMKSYFKTAQFKCDHPEDIENPFNEIDLLMRKFLNRGLGSSKIKLAKSLVNNGLSFQNILNHPNCSSAKYFHNKLIQYSNN
jgi:hypothetical protein